MCGPGEVNSFLGIGALYGEHLSLTAGDSVFGPATVLHLP